MKFALELEEPQSYRQSFQFILEPDEIQLGFKGENCRQDQTLFEFNEIIFI